MYRDQQCRIAALLLHTIDKWKLVMPHYEWPDDDASTVFV